MSFFTKVRRWWISVRGKRAFTNLLNGQFAKVWSDKDIANFDAFLRQQAVPAGAFLITMGLDEGGLIWFHYTVETVPEGGFIVGNKVEMQFPKEENPSNRECPIKWKGLPIWRYTGR